MFIHMFVPDVRRYRYTQTSWPRSEPAGVHSKTLDQFLFVLLNMLTRSAVLAEKALFPIITPVEAGMDVFLEAARATDHA